MLSDVELLARVIGAKEAQKLYEGKLTPLFKLGPSGRKSLQKLGAAHELVRRSLFEELRREHVMRDPACVRNYLRVTLGKLEYESFVGLFLDSQHHLLACEELARGTIDSAAVYPREVVKRALALNAAAVIFGHPHPSGVAEPSAADRALTTRLKESLALIDVRVLDHFIVGGNDLVSFAEKGWL
jgi:DNA repair protein RadC